MGRGLNRLKGLGDHIESMLIFVRALKGSRKKREIEAVCQEKLKGSSPDFL